jgi:hypothetical protein
MEHALAVYAAADHVDRVKNYPPKETYPVSLNPLHTSKSYFLWVRINSILQLKIISQKIKNKARCHKC